MTWYSAKVKGAGMKPITANAWIEADSEEDAKQRAEEILKDHLFGVKWVKVFETDKETDAEIQSACNKLGGPNKGYKKDGTKIARNTS